MPSAAGIGFGRRLPVCRGSASNPSISTLISFSRLLKLGCCLGGGTLGESCALRMCVCGHQRRLMLHQGL